MAASEVKQSLCMESYGDYCQMSELRVTSIVTICPNKINEILLPVQMLVARCKQAISILIPNLNRQSDVKCKCLCGISVMVSCIKLHPVS